MIWCSAYWPTHCSTTSSRTSALRETTPRALDRDGRHDDHRARARVLLRAHGRRPGLHAEDLLHPRPNGDRGAVRVRVGRRQRDPAPAHARPEVRPALVRRDPPQPDPRRRRAGHRLDLGEGELGPLVGVGRADARLVPHRVPALRDLPADALLDRGPREAGALRERLRGDRRRVRPAQLHRGPPRAGVHAPARVRDGRRRPAREDAAPLLPVAARDDALVHHAVALRDGLEEHLGEAALPAAQARRRRRGRPRRPHGGAEPPDDVIIAQTTNALPDNTGYVAAAYLVFFALVLIYVVIMASKLARFERQLTELNDLVDERGGFAGAAAPAQASGDPDPEREEAARR